ncbi:MAG: hypothetical protein JST84_00775 [Acidobacteria bacterium]|nr:hypothetical protein [Acidobacteriota bacterium]
MIVTMDIFSGMPNPSWKLNDKDARRLTEQLAGKALSSADATDGSLGYRGYVITSESDDEATAAGLPAEFRLGGNLPGDLLTPRGLALPSLSDEASLDASLWLLQTVQGAADDDLLSYVEGVVKAQSAGELAAPPKKGRKVEEPAFAAPCVIQNTAYNPGFWNTPQVQPVNNCYNYAMNYRSDTFAQPGRISGHMYTALTCANVGAAADWDGCRSTCSGSSKTVALVIWPGRDFHWYRKHSNGFWGHKPGSTAARNTDNRNRVIGGALTPANCDRGPYTSFCGYRFSPVGMKVK